MSTITFVTSETPVIIATRAAASKLFLGHSGEFWDQGLILSVCAGGIVAAAVAVTTIGSIGAHKREAEVAEAQRQLSELETARKVADAGAAAAAAKWEAENARLKGAEANERAATLETEAANARLETEKLKQIASWRTLSPVESQHIVSALASGPISVSFLVARDPEAVELFNQIAAAFSKAGVDMSAGASMWGVPPIIDSDIIIRGDGPDVHRIKSALESGGLKVSLEKTTASLQVGVLFKPRAKLIVPRAPP